MNPPDTAPPHGVADHDTDLRTLIALIWRGRWTALGIAGLAGGAAALIMASLPSRFDAEAQILLDTRDRNMVEYQQVVGDLSVDNAVVASEIAVLRSRQMLHQIAIDLRLDETPEFSAPRPGLRDLLAARLRTVSPEIADQIAPARAPRAPLETAVERLDQALTTSQKGRSYVIAVTVRTGDAALSSRIANALSEAYIDDQLLAKSDATSRASDWLKRRIAELKQQSAAADANVEQYRAEQSFGDGQGVTVTDQQLTEINTQLVSARASRAEAEARHDQISRLIADKGEAAAANVLSSPLILSLRQQRAEVKRREAELDTRYGPKHPQMINVKAELRDIGGAIAAELRKRVATLANDAEVARAREAALTAALSDVEDRSVDLSRASVGLRQLEREAEASRRIYEDVLARYKETTEQQDIQQADARVISTASPAASPAAPRRGLITGLAAIGGALLGFGFVFLAEVTANTFRTAAEAERALGLRVFAKLPIMRGGRRRSRLLSAMKDRPNSAYAEAVRGLRNAFLTSAAPADVIMITSAAPDEGKSSTCLALAQSSAAMGRTAVVLECDFRRPSAAEAMGDSRRSGVPDLLDVLNGEATVDEAAQPLAEDGAFALTLRAPAPKAADLLSSQKFRQLIASLGRTYDLVLLDTPPVLAVSDAAVIAPVADQVLMLVRWNHTARQAAEACVKTLAEAGAPPAGVVLTMVDPTREASYEYGGYRRGAPDYGAYYAAG